MRACHWLVWAALSTALQGCVPIVVVGAGAGVLMGSDRRTSGSYLEDTRIESRAAKLIYNQYKDSVHVNVTSFNRQVLLTGEVPSEADKSGVANLVNSEPNIKSISNELVVSALSSFTARSNDSLLTSNVKLRFLSNKIFQPDHVKVVTEANVVFLMGLVYHKEADAATEIARNSKSVDRVVTLFEYLD